MSQMTATSSFDNQKAAAFAGRVMNALNDAAFCLMASIGHRTGLFDAMRDQPPLTSGEVAARAGLNERYVREWLGAMVSLHGLVPALHDRVPGPGGRGTGRDVG
jgi:hypothetical protein